MWPPLAELPPTGSMEILKVPYQQQTQLAFSHKLSPASAYQPSESRDFSTYAYEWYKQKQMTSCKINTIRYI
jgi:hypothetical protein